MLKQGRQVPEFTLKNQDAVQISLKEIKGKWIVMYFYPKDDTPGCTEEALDFTKLASAFEQHSTVVIGVSPDSVKSHTGFVDKHKLDLTLLSDPEHTLIEAFGAWQLKKNSGKEHHGVVRSTFLINPEGTIVHAWPKVSAKGHAEEVLEKVKEIRGE